MTDERLHHPAESSADETADTTGAAFTAWFNDRVRRLQ